MSTDPLTGSQDTGASATESEPLSVSVWGSLSAMAIEPESRALAGRDPVTARHAGTVSRTPPSRGSRLDLTMVSPAEDVFRLDYEEDEEEDALAFLLSESDEQEEDTFMSPAQAAKPEASAALPGDSTPASPGLSMDLQAVCKRAAARLNVPWPEIAKETSRSRYEGKHLPQAAGKKRQLLPVFPEMLDEVSGLVERPTPHTYSDSCTLASYVLANGDISAAVRAALAASTTQGHTVPSGGGRSFTHTQSARLYGPGP
ncbi:hypothetical protein CgunFtcFv8_024929 [Champsocephalus gunnari]|uniref:Uncharacterized protein n=1 Tax=Champsocephalus gunnari TaxID=52237 RepID=A0AAN8DNE7_CHAGU|nr:hypothetical protein CgunFtcFv8_024929 [Champsocephalus gunnari]